MYLLFVLLLVLFIFAVLLLFVFFLLVFVALLFLLVVRGAFDALERREERLCRLEEVRGRRVGVPRLVDAGLPLPDAVALDDAVLVEVVEEVGEERVELRELDGKVLGVSG